MSSIEVEEDRFTGARTLRTPYTVTSFASGDRIGVNWAMIFAEGKKTPDFFGFAAQRVGNHWKFLMQTEALFLVDGSKRVTPMECSMGDHEVLQSAQVSEVMVAMFFESDVPVLSQAVTLEVRLSGFEVNLTQTLPSLRELRRWRP